MPKIFFHQGPINLDSYIFYKNQAEKTDSKGVVLIFPGNEGHHKLGTTLLSKKNGSGLASVAGTLGDKGYPALSLPTTGFSKWSSDTQKQQIVKDAVADLYRALGAGYDLLLPIRLKKSSKHFFNGKLNLQIAIDDVDSPPEYEPSFWGGEETANNLLLADYYMEQLNKLNAFITYRNTSGQSDENIVSYYKKNFSEMDYFIQAYLDGKQKACKNDLWLQKPVTTSAVHSIGILSGAQSKSGPVAQTNTPQSTTQGHPKTDLIMAACVVALASMGLLALSLTGTLPIVIGLSIAAALLFAAAGLGVGAVVSPTSSMPRV